MKKHVMLYVWIERDSVYNCSTGFWWCDKIYSSRSYAINKAKQKGYKKIRIDTLNPFNSFDHEKSEIIEL